MTNAMTKSGLAAFFPAAESDSAGYVGVAESIRKVGWQHFCDLHIDSSHHWLCSADEIIAFYALLIAFWGTQSVQSTDIWIKQKFR